MKQNFRMKALFQNAKESFTSNDITDYKYWIKEIETEIKMLSGSIKNYYQKKLMNLKFGVD